MTTLAVTGHRPDKLFARNPYSPESFELLHDFAAAELQRFSTPPAKVLTGMALGWDQAIASACIELSIPFCACIPFDGQEGKWPAAAKETYRNLLRHAAEQTICFHGGYAAWKMLKRNEFMVKNSELALALWNGDGAGGTAHCVGCCEKAGKVWDNCWQRWIEFREAGKI